MNLLEKIDSDLKAAIKSGDRIRVDTLKMLKSDVSYEKGKTGKELTDDQLLELVMRSAKRRRESIKEFQKGNRQDLVEREMKELAVVEEYLPKQMSEDEIDAFISDKLSAMGAVTQKDLGRIMGEIMKELKGKADGSAVKTILSKKFENK
ncbi:MAG: hypothetical protein A2176_07160 [Spirochaetes bacterium RBG_13_51_14]|nr:MAG: hypothetical protein A2176_07160 [Spirochaetes bacterium RBG_13_51_14]